MLCDYLRLPQLHHFNCASCRNWSIWSQNTSILLEFPFTSLCNLNSFYVNLSFAVNYYTILTCRRVRNRWSIWRNKSHCWGDRSRWRVEAIVEKIEVVRRVVDFANAGDYYIIRLRDVRRSNWVQCINKTAKSTYGSVLYETKINVP